MGRRYSLVSLLLAGLVGAAVVSWQPQLAGLDARLVDARFRMRGPAPHRTDIVIVAADERSVAEMARRQGARLTALGGWPRSMHARLLDILGAAGARVVVFDWLFSEPDPKQDEVFGQAITRFGRVVLSMHHAQGVSPLRLHPSAARWFSYRPPSQDVPLVRLDLVPPVPALLGDAAQPRAAGLGFAEVPSESEVFRRVYLAARCPQADGRIYLSLPMAAGLVAQETPVPLSFHLDEGSGTDSPYLQMGERRIPIDRASRLWINYRGPAHTFRHLSYVEVLDGTHQAELHGAIVLVGATASGLGGLYPSPWGPDFSGVEQHANVLDNILEGRWLTVTSSGTERIIVVALTLLLGLTLSRLRPALGALLLGAVGLGYCGFTQHLFVSRHVHIALAAPLITMAGCYLAITTHRLGAEERQRRQAHDTLAAYVSPGVARRLAARPEALRLGGDRQLVTVLFADIRGFTALAEERDPRQVVSLLNTYFQAMVEVVFRHRGTVDKYLGDGLLVLFNAPESQPDHVQRALRTAGDMLAAVDLVRPLWQAEGTSDLRIGIVIHTGQAVVGNVGSERRKQYTAIGDTVNVAAHLQTVCAALGESLLISEAVFAQLEDAVAARAIDGVHLPGRRTPIRVYAVDSPLTAADGSSWPTPTASPRRPGKDEM